MARQRNYRDEYARRLQLGRQRGVSKREARGHGATPERPAELYRQPERFPRYLQRLNARRAQEGLGPIHFQAPPTPGPNQRQREFSSRQEADDYIRQIGQPTYTRVYIAPDGTITAEIDRPNRARRRAA